MGNGVYFTRATNGSSSDNDSVVRRKFTWSAWCKLGANWDAGYYGGFFAAAADGSNFTSLKRDGNEYLNFEVNQGGSSYTLVSDYKLRDYSAWYHIMIVYDSTLATQADRAIMYINGVRSTTSSAWNGTQNLSADFGNTSATSRIGMYGNNTGNAYGYTGYMSEVNLTIGYALSPSSFGETDSTTGEWKPRSSPNGVTYSPNGYYLKFTNAGALGTDSSGNGNTYSITNNDGSMFQTVDTPQNSFCVMNPLDNYFAGASYEEGNLYISSPGSAYAWSTSTFGLSSGRGKWYVEAKVDDVGSGSDNFLWGISSLPSVSSSAMLGSNNRCIAYRNNGNYKTNDANSTYGGSFSNGQIVMMALDLENNNIYFGSQGYWGDGSGNTDEGSPTAAISLTNVMGGYNPRCFFAFGDGSGSSGAKVKYNFGNPQFTISSGNSDANGYGNFEYAPPSGYFSVCTKNINQYG